MTALDFIISDWDLIDLGFATVGVTGGPSILTLAGNGTTSLVPVSSWVAALGSLSVSLTVGRSTADNSLGSLTAKFRIRATLTCVHADGSVNTVYEDAIFGGGDQQKCDCCGQSAVLGSTLAGQWWHSSGLADCSFVTAVGSGGFSGIETHMLESSHDSGGWCICATGGTGYVDDAGNEFAPVYEYQLVSGALQSGQSLNKDTGCIEGTADGSDPGTPEVTFRVLDKRDPDGGYAEVTCGIIRPGCTATPQIGNWLI